MFHGNHFPLFVINFSVYCAQLESHAFLVLLKDSVAVVVWSPSAFSQRLQVDGRPEGQSLSFEGLFNYLGCMIVLPACVSVHHLHAWCRWRWRASMWVLRIRPRSFPETSALNHWTNSPAQSLFPLQGQENCVCREAHTGLDGCPCILTFNFQLFPNSSELLGEMYILSDSLSTVLRHG